MSILRLGTAGTRITPPLGLQLSGYGFRNRGADEVQDDLEARVFWFETDDGNVACLISADLIGFGAGLTQRLRRDLGARYGLAAHEVMLCASHTHSGPQTCENMARVGGSPDPDYIESLCERLLEAVGQAKASGAPVTMRTGYGSLSGYAVNRRAFVGGAIAAVPNPKGVRDDQVSVLLFQDTELERVRAALFHYTCHPTVMGSYAVTSDYPGSARRYLEQEFPGAAFGFLPGCFGDVRPACTLVGGEKFRRGTPQDVEAFGHALGKEVARVVYATAHVETARSAHELSGAVQDIALPLVDGNSAVLSLHRLDLAEDVSLVALGGEICVDYGHWIKQMRPGKVTLPVGYSNGMVGYISSERMFAEGGYEPDGSTPYFDLSAPFDPSIQGRLLAAIEALLR